MATIAFTRSFPEAMSQRVGIITWSSLAAGDDGQPFSVGQFADRTVQVVGTITGGNITIQGSLDGANWHTLTDPQGNPLVFTAAGLEAVTELTYFIRPLASGGLTGSGVGVILAAKGAA